MRGRGIIPANHLYYTTNLSKYQYFKRGGKMLKEKASDFIYKITWTVEMLILRKKALSIKEVLKLGGWL